MSAEQLPIIMIAVPLVTAFVVNILGRWRPNHCAPIVAVSLAIALAAAIGALTGVVANGKMQYRLGGWAPPMGIEYVVDHLNCMVLILILLVGLLNTIYSKNLLADESAERIANFYALYILLITGLLGIAMTGDAFNLYVLLEVTSLTSYALLGMAKGKASYSTFKYVIAGTIGACFYLLGVGYLYMKTGTLNIADLHSRLAVMDTSPAIHIAFVLIMIGVWAKMAFFPLHGWLPDAYTDANPAISGLVAPLMTKVSVYIMIRMMFSVFNPEFVFELVGWRELVMGLAIVAMVFGSLSALAQKDAKRMLTYIIVAEIGYMVGGTWLANTNGYIGAVYHILSDGMMTLCLFLAVGCIAHRRKSRKLADFRGIYREMPVTMVGFTIGAFSMIGIPPTCGFFSKWYLLSGAIDAGHWGFLIALLTSSLVNVVLFFRIIELGFLEPFHEHGHHGDDADDHGHGDQHHGPVRQEAPLSMLIPLLLSAATLLLLGLYTGEIVTHVVQVPAGLAGAGAP